MTKLKYCAYDNKNFAFVNIANNFKNLYGSKHMRVIKYLVADTWRRKGKELNI